MTRAGLGLSEKALKKPASLPSRMSRGPQMPSWVSSAAITPHSAALPALTRLMMEPDL
ncbi:hypothetical protein D3C83_108440 [compost metagenome]